ncbi:transposase zinc-binding domain-containing protein, partial [Stieleria sp. ICT_E10.1]
MIARCRWPSRFNRSSDAISTPSLRVSREMLRAAWCIQHCRTRTLGGHVNSCPEGHYHSIAYNSCRHRCCPQHDDRTK